MKDKKLTKSNLQEKKNLVGYKVRGYSKKQKTVGLTIGGLVFLIGIPIILVTVSLLIDERLNLSYLIPNPLNFVVAIIFIAPGLLFVIWSGFTQLRVGKGTPVPAIPAQRLEPRAHIDFVETQCCWES